MLVSAQACVLHQNIPLSCDAVGHTHLWKSGSGVGEARLRKYVPESFYNGFMGLLFASGVLFAGVHVVAMRV